MKTYYRNHNLN